MNYQNAYAEAYNFINSGKWKNVTTRQEKETFRNYERRIKEGGTIGVAAVAKCLTKLGYEIIFKKVG